MKRMIMLIVGILLLSQITVALPTYVGIDLVELKDTVCNKDMKIVSNPQDGFPLFFNVTDTNGQVIWQGDSTEDLDYASGDVIMLPEPIDLQLGEVYNIMMDVDMVSIQRSEAGWVYVHEGTSTKRSTVKSGKYSYSNDDAQETCTTVDATDFNNECGYSTNQNYKVALVHADREGNEKIHLAEDGTLYTYTDNNYQGCQGLIQSVYEDKFWQINQPDKGNFNFQFIYE